MIESVLLKKYEKLGTTMLDNYVILGGDFLIHIYCDESEKYTRVKISELTDDQIKDKQLEYISLINSGVDIKFSEMLLYIYTDFQKKRRFEKIKKIKEKITHDNTIKTV